MEKYTSRKFNMFTALVTLILAALCCGAIVGCGSGVRLEFTVESISLAVGEARDIFPYAKFTPSITDDKSFTLSSDSDCVSVDGTTVTAVAAGTAKLTATASGGSAKLTVVCGYSLPQLVYLSAEGETVQTAERVTDIAAVRFTASFDDRIDPDIAVTWSVNGNPVTGNGNVYEFTPSGYGEYTVRADFGGVFDEVSVKIYRPSPVKAQMNYEGELDQASDFSPVHFFVTETVDSRNPSSTYEWSVNGEVLSQARTFEYTPQAAGTYAVGLRVNGIACTPVTVTATGLRAPNGTVVFDDAGGVYVTWRDGGYVRSVSVTTEGGTTVYDAGDLVQSQLFERGRFDASKIIDVCGETPSVYRIRLIADAAGQECEFEQYPMEAQPFLSNKILLKNSFISSERDATDYITEIYAQAIYSGRVYFSREVDADDIISAMTDCAEKLGATVSIDKESEQILFVVLSDCVNSPTSVCNVSAMQMYAVLPHVEYDAQNRRPSAYVLNIDRQKRTLAVTGSEQLLYAVMSGVKPIAPKDEVAGIIYNRARNVLLGIIGKDYDEYDKVHAIYDWVQWSTYKADGASGSSADYLEGVFCDYKDRDNKYIHSVVSSMGAAKTFSLLCGMEGIYTQIECQNGKYYNTVTINGVDYKVDVFGGEYVYYAYGDSRETTTHAGLFVDAAGGMGRTFYTEKHIYNNVYFDYYIAPAEFDDYDMIKAVVDFEIDAQADITSVTIRNANGSTTISYSGEKTKLFNIELFVGELNEVEYNGVVDSVTRAIKENVGCEDGAIRINRYGNVLHVGVSYSRR